MHYLFSLAVLAFGLTSWSAQAASPLGNYYGAVYLGAAILSDDDRWSDGQGFAPRVMPPPSPPDGYSQTSDTRNVTFEYDTGFSIGGAIGGWIGNYLRADVSIGYRLQDLDSRTKIIRKDANGALYYLRGAEGVIETNDDGDPMNDPLTTAFATEAQVMMSTTDGVNYVGQPIFSDGALAGDLNNVVVIGPDANDAGVFSTDSAVSGEISVIPIMFNVYFYPLNLFTVKEIPSELNTLYIGVGVGVGLYSVDAGARVDDGFAEALTLTASVGYDFYVMENVAVGGQYQYSFGYDITPDMAGAAIANSPFPEIGFHKSSHNIHLTARYEF